MSERMNFASFYERPKVNSTRLMIGHVTEAIGSRFGRAVEVMLLSYGAGCSHRQTFPVAEGMLDVMPAPNTLLFVYGIPDDGSPGQSCVSLDIGEGAAAATVSLPDMAVAADAELAVELCAKLHLAGLTLAQRCVVAAGGECELSASLPTAAAALAEACAHDSLATWVACDADALPEPPAGYALVRHSATSIVLGRRR